jgi:S-adenosylmethionine:tRNA ribosyltransferase-isomerase
VDLAEFDYLLPPDRIAQEPAPRREDARLLMLPRLGAGCTHHTIADLPALLRSGDLLVVNDTKVRRARLFGRKGTGGEVEVLLLERVERGCGGGELWSALVGGGARPGASLALDGGIVAEVLERPVGEDGEFVLALRAPDGEPIDELLERVGTVPLPPYIHREPGDPRATGDRERYQTVFAHRLGSAAAPTAGLHLSLDLLAAVRDAGVEVTAVTLHVGRGTFQPIRAARIEDHRMHAEWCMLTTEAAERMTRARARGGRISAVGTTVVRTLEARWGDSGPVPGQGAVDLFLRPGDRFRAVDGLLTNFHLPRSSLLVLVSAFAGRERVLAAYREAVVAGYRFYSFGDAMLVL